MKIFFALVVGIAVGAAAVGFYNTRQGKSAAHTTGDQIESSAKSTRDLIQEKLKMLDLRSEDIKDDLARTGQVVRRKAREISQSIADSTADARTTATIKGKLLANRDLSATSISVNTTSGVVTLAGSVSSPEDIGKAVLLAMETDGVREVISSLQVKKVAKAN
jgi:hyperosmotically inducible periplasmic protein